MASQTRISADEQLGAVDELRTDQRNVERRTHVVQLGPQRSMEIGTSSSPLYLWPQLSKTVAQIAQMAARNQIALARIGKFLRSIGARRFEQPVAHRVALRLGQHQRLIDQRRQHVEDVEFVKAPRRFRPQPLPPV